jgi:predicted ATPase
LFDNSSEVVKVNQWLEVLDIPYSLRVTPVSASGSASLLGDLVALVLTDRRAGVDVTPADVGFGVSQVLPIVVQLLAKQRSVICIEQPEIHLHPRLQTRLADLLIETTAQDGRANQVLVETHSEHLVLRLRRRIREGTLESDRVAVLYVDTDADGASRVTRLRLDDQGDFLDEWPAGFFDERLEELFGGAE